jgi:hypothetical protein
MTALSEEIDSVTVTSQEVSDDAYRRPDDDLLSLWGSSSTLRDSESRRAYSVL